MSDFVAVPAFFLSIAFTLFFAVLIGRKIFKTGIEHFSSRMLILIGIFNAFLCIGLLFCQAASNSSMPTAERLFAGLLITLIPARILWNYLTLQKNITTQFNLEPHGSNAVTSTIASLSKSMEIVPPMIFSSDLVRAPFVFGRRSSKACLAIPNQWHGFDYSRSNPILLHEMAHIRNHDIGFLAWSQAYTKDLKWLLIIFPALIALGYALQYQQITSSICIYLSCLLALFGLLKYTLRKREFLADMTAALLIESGHIEQAIFQHSAKKFDHHINSTQRHKTGLGDSVYRWLIDKAMFSKYPKRWQWILRVFTFFRVSHPERSKRIDNVSSINERIASPQVTLGANFWTGITLGFLGVVIGLCGYWLSDPSQYAPDDVDCLRLSYTLYGLAAPPAVGFWVVFVTLPFWASLGSPNMDRTFFRLLLKRHSIAFLGTCIVSLLILTAGPLELHFKVLFILCILWQLLIVLMGFCVSIVSVFLWNVIRYFQGNSVKNLSKTLWTLIPLLIVSLGGTFLGMWWIRNGRVFQGTNFLFSTLVGIAVFLKIVGRSRFSEPDHYMTVSFILFTCQIEGNNFLRWNKLIDMVVYPTVLLFPMLLLYWGVFLLFRDTLDDLSVRSAIISLIIIGCIILVLIQLSEKGNARIARRPKIHRLFHCLKLLSKPLSAENLKKIAQVANGYGLKDRKLFNRRLNLTIGDIYELYHLTEKICPELSEQATEWALECQRSGGFGLWPNSGPRLISTYQALSILKGNNQLDTVNSSEHVSWIKSCHQPDGSSKGPWSKRKAWEDTFFAVKSLDILGASLETDEANRCRQWCHCVLQDGIAKDRPDTVYYSIAALEALGQLDEDTTHMTSGWLSERSEKLLLVNIGLNYENVHYTVMTYHILNQITPQTSMVPHIKLLAERIQSALDAELADIRCK